ncbi:MAG: VacJ family lipoprotein [Pseudomonadota bacterium]
MRKLRSLLGVVVLAGALGACTPQEGPRDGFAATDPYESTNRAIHAANVRADRYVLRPAAQGYDLVTPELFKHLIGNGLSHLDTANDFANFVLQADVDRGLNSLGRFTINTLLGAGGLLDPATEFGLVKDSTDFGLTLGTYGVGEGPYLVLPLLGPSNARDLGGFVVDRALSPTLALGPLDAPGFVGPALTGVELVDRRDRNGDLIDGVLYESADSYVTLRAAYLQRRRAQIAGDDAAENLPDIFDDEQPTN